MSTFAATSVVPVPPALIAAGNSPMPVPAVTKPVAPAKEPTANRMLITPEMARRWLADCNVANRHMVLSYCERLARDMKEGRWILTHEGIAFDPQGRLLDGQQRLRAIVIADVAVEMFVWLNVTPKALLAINIGRKRTLTDSLLLSSSVSKVSPQHLATLRAMLGGFGARPTLTTAEAAAEYQKHREAIEFAHTFLPSGRTVKGITLSCVRAVVSRAYYSADLERLGAFCQILTQGMANQPNHQVVVMLFQYLLRNAGSARMDRERYVKTAWALQAFLRYEQPARLMSSSQELFPLADEAK
ncbi:MAG: hypothetical protein FWD61_00235 [Phycisphaerales bacterium]|nr:hypothetical protein [Phycisphaerales bacterium]